MRGITEVQGVDVGATGRDEVSFCGTHHGVPPWGRNSRIGDHGARVLGGLLASIVLSWVATSPAAGQHPVHPPMADQKLQLTVKSVSASGFAPLELTVRVPSGLAEATLQQEVQIPGATQSIRLLRYLPHATLEQRVAPAEPGQGRPAAEVLIEGPTQKFRRWLIADDPERNRLTSFIGTWRLMSVPDADGRRELFKLFDTELTRSPQLLVGKPDGTQTQKLPLTVDKVQALPELDCSIRVLRFYPDYAQDRDSKEAVNRSDRRKNPAALVEITHTVRTEQRWVFAKFPAFEPKDTEKVPIHVRLDCPIEGSGTTPDFALVVVGLKDLEVWTRQEEKTTSATVTVGQAVPIAGSQYSFQVPSWLAAGAMTEEYQAAPPGKGVAALQIEVPGKSGSAMKTWLALGESKTVSLPVGDAVVSFGSKAAGTPGGHP